MTLTLPYHPTQRHPLTGRPVRAIGLRKSGAPIWPAMGGDDTVPSAPVPAPAPAAVPTPSAPVIPVPAPVPAATVPTPQVPATGADELGDSGKRALAAEREARKAAEDARKAAEKQAADVQAQLAQLAPLQKLAAALGGGDADKGKSEMEQLTERLAAQEAAIKAAREEAATERLARIRADVAAEKGLTKAQAARLVGATEDELKADADALLELFPRPAAPAAPAVEAPPAEAKPAPQKKTPKPDPSQGARGDAPVRSAGLHAAITGHYGADK